MDIIQSFKGGLIVSCQALEDEPLYVPGYMAKMALAAKQGGACGIRANTPEDIVEIKKEVDLPIIGIWKIVYSDSEVYITPTLEAAKQIYKAGADIIAVDSTFRKNCNGKYAWELIKEIKKELPVLVMADISTFEEGLNAETQGADLISTTLCGYTNYSLQIDEPNFELINKLSTYVKIPVIAEGKIWTPYEAKKALDIGAYAVVVGSAITRPQEITKRFTKIINGS